jgi:hypothetical protein
MLDNHCCTPSALGSVTQADLELVILLLPPLECSDYTVHHHAWLLFLLNGLLNFYILELLGQLIVPCVLYQYLWPLPL